MKRYITLSLLLTLCFGTVQAQTATAPTQQPDTAVVATKTAGTRTFREKHRFMPTAKRIDRQINHAVFAYKGEVTMGLTASYGTISGDNADVFAILESINLSGSVTTINPYIGYFYRNNACFGVRVGYTYMGGTLDNMDVNLGNQNDLDINIPWLDLSSNSFKVSVFHRNFVPIDHNGRFGVFSEIEASASFGHNKFAYKSDDSDMHYTKSDNTTFRIWFNPGLAVYAFPNVCATVSFGMGGFKYTTVKQFDQDGNPTGNRTTSKLRFRLNLADIHFGMNIHLWNKHKNRMQ